MKIIKIPPLGVRGLIFQRKTLPQIAQKEPVNMFYKLFPKNQTSKNKHRTSKLRRLLHHMKSSSFKLLTGIGQCDGQFFDFRL
jgi:hypothetical protein